MSLEEKLKQAISDLEYAIIGFNEIKEYVAKGMDGDAETWAENYADILQNSLDKIKS